MNEDRRVAALSEVPDDATLLVTLRPVGNVADDTGDVGADEAGDPEVEAMLIRLSDGVAAYRNYCQHWTDVRLNKGDGGFVRNGEIFCRKHGATFEGDSGYCNFGPCEGATLDRVEVSVADDAVYLTDEDYEFVRVGPAERDEAEGGSRIDFTGS